VRLEDPVLGVLFAVLVVWPQIWDVDREAAEHVKDGPRAPGLAYIEDDSREARTMWCIKDSFTARAS
jgi:hypothetical protein